MKINWAFLRLVLYWFGGVLLLATYPLAVYGTSSVRESVIVAAIVSIVNLLVGYAAIEYAFEKPHEAFLKVVLGSMTARLFVLAGLVLVLIKVIGFDALSLMIALLGFYVLNLALEVYYLQKKVTLTNQR
ncbi:MAG: hypothetical protein FJ215_09445 [Ignavibacteria bacterium]|nr:hypothetical protein [Ignavibacteria bacterium]